MDIPSKSDWEEIDPNDLDANHAFAQFFGKSFEEAVSLFEENALFYQEDLLSMPPIPFNFYAPAFAKYMNSQKAAGDSDGASTFLRMCIWMLETKRHIVSKGNEKLLFETAEKISQNQGFYDADPKVYGQFPQLFGEIRAIVEGT